MSTETTDTPVPEPDGMNLHLRYRARTVRGMSTPYLVTNRATHKEEWWVHIETYANGQIEYATVPLADVVPE